MPKFSITSLSIRVSFGIVINIWNLRALRLCALREKSIANKIIYPNFVNQQRLDII